MGGSAEAQNEPWPNGHIFISTASRNETPEICRKRYVYCKDVEFCSPRQSSFINAFGADFLHFTIFATLQTDEMTAWAGRQAGRELN